MNMKKSLLVGALCPLLALATTVAPAFAVDTPVAGPGEINTTVSYTVAASEWTWSIPTSVTIPQKYENGAYADSSAQGTLSVNVKNNGIITLATGKQMEVKITESTNYNDGTKKFYLKDTDSEIEYTIKAGANALEKDKAFFTYYPAGTDGTKGKTQNLIFGVTRAAVEAAKRASEHTDSLTFTLAVVNKT